MSEPEARGPGDHDEEQILRVQNLDLARQQVLLDCVELGDMLPNIGYVSAGVVELMKKQKQGYAYIRP
jgi:intracellular sulfur oxidation DsrE/DsrF family protein